MPFHVDGPAFSVALVRIALALYLLSAGLAMAGLPMPTPTQGQPWLPAGNLGALTPVIVSALLACGALLVAGIESALVALTVLAQLALFLTIWLIDNPLHNTMNHLVPFGAAALFIFAAAEHDRYRLGSRAARFRFSDQTRASVLVLTARVYLGSVFLAQGVRSAFGRGLMNFAQALYVGASGWIVDTRASSMVRRAKQSDHSNCRWDSSSPRRMDATHRVSRRRFSHHDLLWSSSCGSV
ncbi:MAG: hypothetical protein M3541_23080 [Acidobacteriota bacterium]|nr:hypothetical protein [Acidobacteriota bacterium]